MVDLGDVPVNAVLDFKWNTQGANGASITRSTDGTLKLYKGNSATERSSLAGVTQTEDFDAATGVHHVRIDLSDNTDAGFYAAGSEYQVVMTGMTIDGQTVNAVIAHFSIERTGGVLALLKANRAEPGQGAPAASTTGLAKIDYLYKAWRNKVTQTATEYKLFADDAATVDQKATLSDDATTLTKGEIATGP